MRCNSLCRQQLGTACAAGPQHVAAESTDRRDGLDAEHACRLLVQVADVALGIHGEHALDDALQQPFKPTHANMASLKLDRDQDTHVLAAELRRAFSGIVAGNVKEEGMRRIEQFGPFEIHGDADMMQALDALLRAFVEQGGAVLALSSDLLELIGLCDRILMVRGGRIVGDVVAATATEESLLALALSDARTEVQT